MDEIRAKELLPAKALGCLDTEENENFLKLMEEDGEFPWQEFGQYQNLVAHMPTLLEFETPDPEVKNKIVNEIQAQVEEVQVEEEIETEAAQDLTETAQNLNDTVEVIEDEELIIEEEEIIPQEFEQESEIEIDERRTKLSDGISIKEHVKPEFDLKELQKAKSKVTKEQKEKAQEKEVEKEVRDKSTKNYVSKFAKEEKAGILGSNKLLTVAAIVIVIILVLLLVMYLGLSSEIDDNKQEIQKLKQRIGIALIHEKSFPVESKIV
jgi:anti-sigma-K factor RskA